MRLGKICLSLVLVFLLAFSSLLTVFAETGGINTALVESTQFVTQEENDTSGPEEPVDPEEPEEPVELEEPAEPEGPVEPEEPGDLEEPTVPEKPSGPEEPQIPENPVEPEEPVGPEEPMNPEEPAEPEEPVEPVDPEQPQIPGELENLKEELKLEEPPLVDQRGNTIKKFSFFSMASGGGLTVSEMTTPEDLVARLLGEGVTVSNVSFKGTSSSAGTFSGGTGIIGFEEGIILSSGSIYNVVGPNQEDGITGVNGLFGDPDLASLISGITYDATVLEFDFIPETDALAFQYVFASDEYNEYVNSQYNDVFGFFLNGKNVALLPGTDIPVSINNVNGGKPYGENAQNPEYFRNNDLDDGGGEINTEMDGLTVVLEVKAEVKANEVNHIKLAIADVGDRAYDSNVFIKAGSFTGKPKPGQLQFSSPTYSVNEDAGSISIEVTRTEGSYGLVTVDFCTGDGTAKAGLDYTSESGTLSFDDGVKSQSFEIPIIYNPIFEGDKTVNLTLSNPTGGAALGEPATATLTIKDNEVSGSDSSSGGSSSDSIEQPPQTGNLPDNVLIERMPGYVSLSKPIKESTAKNEIIMQYDSRKKTSYDQIPRVYYWHSQAQKWIALATYPGSPGTVKGITGGLYKGWFNVFGVIQPIFVDIAGHWAEEVANRMNGLGILEGYPVVNNDFPMVRQAKLDQEVTRGEFITLLVRVLNIDPQAPMVPLLHPDEARELLTANFSNANDIPEWNQREIAGAVKANLIAGSGNLEVNTPISRIEAAAMVSKALRILPGYKKANLAVFKDADDIPEWAKAALEGNVLVGYPDGSFQATRDITRAEAITVLHRLFVYGLGW
ncbi:MAG: hypothetical protein GXW85_08260 [Clostridia bacterium]|nr:hypothetical protein [Clostridia bacterium]